MRRDQSVCARSAAKTPLAAMAVAATMSVMVAGCSTPVSHAGAPQTHRSHPATPLPEPGSGLGDTKAILIGHSGRWLTNGEGQVVILHGLNMVYKRPPYEPAAAGFGAVAASTLAGDGLDVVRVGVIYSAVEPEPGVFSGSYLDSIAATVAELASRGVYSLLDFHQDQLSVGFGGEGFPAWSVDTDGLPERRYVFPLGYTSSEALAAAYDNFLGRPSRTGWRRSSTVVRSRLEVRSAAVRRRPLGGRVRPVQRTLAGALVGRTARGLLRLRDRRDPRRRSRAPDLLRTVCPVRLRHPDHASRLYATPISGCRSTTIAWATPPTPPPAARQSSASSTTRSPGRRPREMP